MIDYLAPKVTRVPQGAIMGTARRMRQLMDEWDISGPSDVMLPGSDVFMLRLAILIAAVGLVSLLIVVTVRAVRRRRERPQRRRTALVASSLMLVAGLLLCLWFRPPAFFVPEFPGLPELFPNEALFHRKVTDLPVTADSDRIIATMGDLRLQAGASSTLRYGRTGGVPFNFVDDSTPRHSFRFTYSGASDAIEYPMADPPYIQAMPWYGLDDHYVAIDIERGKMWELWAARNWFGSWRAGSGALWDLTSLRYAHGSTTASGLPMFPFTFTYDEVASGSIDHVLSMSAPVVRAKEFQWPARGTDGPSRKRHSPVMGTWFRLRKDADLSGLGPQARVLAEAAQTYGVVLTDTNGGMINIGGVPDARWDNADLATFSTLDAKDLEVVESLSLMVDETSLAARPLREP